MRLGAYLLIDFQLAFSSLTLLMHFAIFREYTEDALSAPSQDFNKNKNMCHNDRSFPISSQRTVAEPLAACIPSSTRVAI